MVLVSWLGMVSPELGHPGQGVDRQAGEMRTLVLTRESFCSSGIARWMCPAGSWNCRLEFVGEVRVGYPWSLGRGGG